MQLLLLFTDVYHTIFDWPSSKEIQARLREVAGYSEEEMVHKLTAFHRHKDGVVRCYASTVKVINADQPKIDTLSQGNCVDCACVDVHKDSVTDSSNTFCKINFKVGQLHLKF